MTQLEKNYHPESIEQKWYQEWEQQGYFAPKQDDSEPYCIMIPPPNVTGTLHMGHAFENTIIDILIRYQRMQGKRSLWQVGTDHAGIATQMVVERELAKNGTKRCDLGRDKFIEKVWQFKDQSGGQITKQLRRMGSSIDWSRERFTLDAGLSEAVTHVFVTLYEQSLIYRKKRLVNWDPILKTAVSDLEVNATEESGHLWTIAYPLESGAKLLVATTRPETLFGDKAVAVHPEDPRYADLIGQMVRLPLTDRLIPIIADSYVDKDFGTGCVKITPAHDFNDYEVGQRHHLEPLNILNQDGTLNQQVPKEYQGLNTRQARALALQQLEASGFLVETKDHKLMVPRGDRSQAVIEPLLTDQWYVNVQELAGPAIAAVEQGEIEFVPKNWENTYFAWMRDVQDWCISRQLWWGHRIPAWYDEQGQVYVGPNLEAVRKKYQLGPEVTLTQDEDVLDTWFSSALWPFSTLGWPKNTPDFQAFYPTQVLVTGFDIIFFWVARMIMFGLHFTKQVPFKKVIIHGLIKDHDGQKMSKSKGNVIDPLDLIDGIALEDLLTKRTSHLMQPEMAAKVATKTKQHFPDGIEGFGTDALRFTFASLASTSRDIQFDFNRLRGYRNFCNKIWNAGRFIIMHLQADDDLGDLPLLYSSADRWILSKLQRTIASAHKCLADSRFDLLANHLYDFVWDEFCAWYLEMAKSDLNNENTTERRGTLYTLVDTFEQILRLLHPISPYVTEEMWHHIAPFTNRYHYKSISIAPYPEFNATKIDAKAETDIHWIQGFVTTVRTMRSSNNISPAKTVTLNIEHAKSAASQKIQAHTELIQNLCKCSSINFLKPPHQASNSAADVYEEMTLLIPLLGLVEVGPEIARLQKQIAKITKNVTKLEQKLANEAFVAKAPAQLIARDKERLSQDRAEIMKLSEQLRLLEQC